MPNITEILEKFDKKTNPNNYEKGRFNTLENAENSLLNTENYPESGYELDKKKVKNFIKQSINSILDEISEVVIDNCYVVTGEQDFKKDKSGKTFKAIEPNATVNRKLRLVQDKINELRK